MPKVGACASKSNGIPNGSQNIKIAQEWGTLIIKKWLYVFKAFAISRTSVHWVQFYDPLRSLRWGWGTRARARVSAVIYSIKHGCKWGFKFIFIEKGGFFVLSSRRISVSSDWAKAINAKNFRMWRWLWWYSDKIF